MAQVEKEGREESHVEQRTFFHHHADEIFITIAKKKRKTIWGVGYHHI